MGRRKTTLDLCNRKKKGNGALKYLPQGLLPNSKLLALRTSYGTAALTRQCL